MVLTCRRALPVPITHRVRPPAAVLSADDGRTRHGRHRRAPEKQASYREVFAIREFRGLWVAQVMSYAGDQFAQVAIAILVYRRTGSPLLTALAYALTYLPPIAGGPLLSALADLFPRRRVMIVCDVIRVGLVTAMADPEHAVRGTVRAALLHRAAGGAVLLSPVRAAARHPAG